MGLNVQFAGPALRTASVSGDSFALEGYNPTSGIYSSGAYVPFMQMTAGNPPVLSITSGVIGASGPAGPLGSGVVISGNVASGAIGNFHVSSGAITSGRLGVTGTPDGSLFLRDNFTWAAIGSGSILSGAIQSGQLGSGTVQGFFGATRHVASGTLGVFDFGSGAIIAGSVGSGAIQSGQIASGQIGFGHFSDNSVQSGTISSGSISRFHLASGAVNSGHLASGTFDQIAPTTTATDLIVFSGAGNSRLAGPTVGGSLLSLITAGALNWVAPPFNTTFATATFLSGAGRLQWRFVTAELISGLKAVAFASGDGYTVVRAERGSGLRLPAIGVTVSGAVSGTIVDVVVRGHLTNAASGMMASGFHGLPLYVGSGGLIIGRSGLDGAISGAPFLSGDAVQKIGMAISGGIWVDPGEVRSGYVTAAAMGQF